MTALHLAPARQRKEEADTPRPLLRVLSLGAGVQSTTVLLMALHGEFPDRLDCAIFADTGWEPKAVYAHLDWLEGKARRDGIPVQLVTDTPPPPRVKVASVAVLLIPPSGRLSLVIFTLANSLNAAQRA